MAFGVEPVNAPGWNFLRRDLILSKERVYGYKHVDESRAATDM
jgi:hypothetical protein